VLDEALRGIRGRYGAPTTDFVAMQLEYPTQRYRSDRESTDTVEWPVAMPRSPR
jgi:hypothetical protein